MAITRRPHTITIAPCMGIGQPMANVTKLAAYIVKEDLMPDTTELLCIPATFRGVDEDLAFLQSNPIIVIEGCPHMCASHILAAMRIRPAARLFLPKLAQFLKIALGPERKTIEEPGQKLAAEAAKRVAQLAQSMLDDPGYSFTPQKVALNPPHLLRYNPDPTDIPEYIKLAEAWSRPAAMPRLPLLEPAATAEIQP